MTGEGIEPPLFLFVRQAPYRLGDPAKVRETRFELAIPVWKTGVIPASPLSLSFSEPTKPHVNKRATRERRHPCLPTSSYQHHSRPETGIEATAGDAQPASDCATSRASGDSGRTRTCVLLFRRQAPCPTELRSRYFKKQLRGRESNSQSPRSKRGMLPITPPRKLRPLRKLFHAEDAETAELAVKWSELELNEPLSLFRRSLIRLSYPTRRRLATGA